VLLLVQHYVAKLFKFVQTMSSTKKYFSVPHLSRVPSCVKYGTGFVA